MSVEQGKRPWDLQVNIHLHSRTVALNRRYSDPSDEIHWDLLQALAI